MYCTDTASCGRFWRRDAMNKRGLASDFRHSRSVSGAKGRMLVSPTRANAPEPLSLNAQRKGRKKRTPGSLVPTGNLAGLCLERALGHAPPARAHLAGIPAGHPVQLQAREENDQGETNVKGESVRVAWADARGPRTYADRNRLTIFQRPNAARLKIRGSESAKLEYSHLSRVRLAFPVPLTPCLGWALGAGVRRQDAARAALLRSEWLRAPERNARPRLPEGSRRSRVSFFGDFLWTSKESRSHACTVSRTRIQAFPACETKPPRAQSRAQHRANAAKQSNALRVVTDTPA